VFLVAFDTDGQGIIKGDLGLGMKSLGIFYGYFCTPKGPQENIDRLKVTEVFRPVQFGVIDAQLF